MPEPDWAQVLDELEESLRRGALAGWTPPSGLGPIPPGLEPRARALLDAQRDAIARVEEELRRIAGELSALRRPAGGGISSAPAYIDTVA